MDDKNGKIEKESIAKITLERMSKIASMADETSARLSDKLAPVMRSAHSDSNASEEPIQEYPPLWNEMRNKLEIIESSLITINRVIDNTEI